MDKSNNIETIEVQKPFRFRKVVKVNTKDFLQEISNRPILFNKKHYKKFTIRNAAWEELGQLFNIKGSDAKLRWRSIRDGFLKHLRQTENNKSERGNWIYYQSMKFLIPYVDQGKKRKYFDLTDHEFNLDDNSISNDELSTIDTKPQKFAEISSEEQQFVERSSDQQQYQESKFERSEHLTHTLNPLPGNKEQTESTEENTDYEMLVGEECVDEENLSNEYGNDRMYLEHQEQYLNESADNNIKVSRTLEINHHVPANNPTSHADDSNEKFLLSCLPSLQRLSIKKNLQARLKIQQILYDIEFGPD